MHLGVAGELPIPLTDGPAEFQRGTNHLDSRKSPALSQAQKLQKRPLCLHDCGSEHPAVTSSAKFSCLQPDCLGVWPTAVTGFISSLNRNSLRCLDMDLLGLAGPLSRRMKGLKDPIKGSRVVFPHKGASTSVGICGHSPHAMSSIEVSCSLLVNP
jgi:hypothetical protein